MALLGAFMFLALLGVSHSLQSEGHQRCPCIERHVDEIKDKLPGHERFGIDCRTHPVNEYMTEHLYKRFGEQMQCDPVSECPWGDSRWCYVDPANCSLNWNWGSLGVAYSHATCGNLRSGTAEYWLKSMATLLGDDPLRVMHLESTLDDGYMGNTKCQDSNEDYPQHQKCQGEVAEFWNRSLAALNQSNVSFYHEIIDKDAPGFMDPNISVEFEAYKQTRAEKWGDRTSTNYDLCAFAAGMGYVDLCVGTMGLTHERQEIAFQIELYTSPVFMISESTCGFLATSDWKTLNFWIWWWNVFSPGAWGFFVAVVLVLTLTMYGLDKSRADIDAEMRTLQKRRNRLADLTLGVFEAFVNKSKSTYSRNARHNNGCPFHMLRLGLNFFLLLTTTIYGSSITAKLISAKEAKGKVSSLGAAKDYDYPVNLCLHEVFRESMKLAEGVEDDNSSSIAPIYFTKWEHVLLGLKNGTCNATLLEEDVWRTWRHKGYLCSYHREATPEFYIPVGAFVSRRAYRSLETFRFDPSESGAFLDQSRVPPDLCSTGAAGSADALCGDQGGVPWFTFASLGAVAVLCCLGGILGHKCPCVEEENNEPENHETPQDRKLNDIEAQIGELLRMIPGGAVIDNANGA